MREKVLVLERTIADDLETIDRLFAALASVRLDGSTPEGDRIIIGYRLHNLYSAFESIFQSVARVFENTVEERSGWHAELLRRMRLDLRPIRPPLIDAEAFDKLDELRRFRHLFRSLYSAQLDPLRMSVALVKARELEKIWPAQIATFRRFLEELRSTAPADEDGDA